MLYQNLDTFLEKPVVDYTAPGDVSDFSKTAVRVRCTYDADYQIPDLLADLVNEPGIEDLEALVIGLWMEGGESYDASPDAAIEVMVAEKEKLAGLRALFVGDIISEENEISWIKQGDMSPLWQAFPRLEYFVARGGNNLRLGRIHHERLTHLTIESGGLPGALVREVLETNAPLTHLELWLGDEQYGASSKVSDFDALLDGELFPDLQHLGLCNCEYADELAAAVAGSVILGRIERLDMSMSVLTDKGGQALLDSGQLGHLALLDLSYHYMSKDMVSALAAAAPGLKASDPQEPDTYGDETYYSVAVSE